jgi:hypothetical protein
MPMPRPHAAAFALALLLSVAAQRAEAQIDYFARIGATGSTRLVRDVLFDPISTKVGIAPTLFAGLSLPIAPRYRFGIEGAVARGSLTGSVESEEGEEDADLGSLTTLTGMAHLEGPLGIPPLRWRVGLGLVHYAAGEDLGAFAQGGTTRYLVGAGADYRRRWFGSWDLMVSARYDFHRFTTDELRARGFTQTQSVQRGSLSLGLARSTS